MKTGWKVPVVSQATPDVGEDLGWIAASNYQGVQNVSGMKWLIFRNKTVTAHMEGAVKLAQMTQEQYNNLATALGPRGAIPESWKKKPEDLPDPSTYEVNAVACIDRGLKSMHVAAFDGRHTERFA